MRRSLIGAVVGVLTLGVAGVAIASEQFQQTFTLDYVQNLPKRSTGVKTLITAEDPGEPNQTPKAAKRVVINFHPGIKFDTTVPAQCTATDAQIQQSQGAACRSGSLVGRGTAQGRVGDLNGAVADLDLLAYNAKNAIIFYARGRAGTISNGQNFAFRGTLRGRSLITNVPAFPFNTAISRFELTVNGRSKRVTVRVRRGRRTVSRRVVKNYITTPPVCPSAGWRTTAIFTYRDNSTQTIHSDDTCRRR